MNNICMIPINYINDNFKEIVKDTNKYREGISNTLHVIGNNVLQRISDLLYQIADVVEISNIDINDKVEYNHSYPESSDKCVICLDCSGTLRFKDENKYQHNDIQKHYNEVKINVESYIKLLFEFTNKINIIVYSNDVYGSLEDNYWRQDFNITIQIIF